LRDNAEEKAIEKNHQKTDRPAYVNNWRNFENVLLKESV